MKVRTVRSLRTASKQGGESHIKYRSVKNKQWDEYLQNRNREKLLYRELFMQHQKWTYLLSEIVHKKILLIFVFYLHSKLKYFWNEMAKMNSSYEGNFDPKSPFEWQGNDFLVRWSQSPFVMSLDLKTCCPLNPDCWITRVQLVR